MKIATQNLLRVAPIFLLLALTSSLLLFVSERREVRWGLDSEAQGLALAIAEFTDPAVVPAHADVMRPALERLMKFGRALRIEVFDLAGAPRLVLALGERAGASHLVLPQVLARAAAGETWTESDPALPGRLVAYATIRSGDGHARALVSVETSDAPLVSHRRFVIRRAAIISGVLLLAGCLVSLVISRIISGEIGRLTGTATAFASGNYEARFEPGVIEEVAVVGSTFGIMGSVLRDATERSTREMLQLERFNTETDLVECYADRFSAGVSGERGGVRLALDRLGPATHGDFWFLARHGGDEYACLGRVDEPPSLEALSAASAAGTLIEACLSGGAHAAGALQQAAGLLPIHCCMLVRWPANARSLEVHRLDSAGAIEQTALDLTSVRTAIMTTLDAESDQKALRYAAAFAFDTPAACVEELRRFLGGGTPGGVMALQAAGGNPPVQSGSVEGTSK